MPPINPTVATLISRTKPWIRKDASAFSESQYIAALNIAKDDVYNAIVSADISEGWFAETSQWGDAAAANYFPVIEPGTDTYSLPANFVQMQTVEVTTSGKEHYEFRKLSKVSTEWGYARERMLQGEVSNEYFYTILGDSPGSFVLPAAPSETLEVRLTYIKAITDWTALADSVSAFPPTVYNLIAQGAAMILQFGLDDKRYSTFQDSLDRRARIAMQTLRRDETGPVFVESVFDR